MTKHKQLGPICLVLLLVATLAPAQDPVDHLVQRLVQRLETPQGIWVVSGDRNGELAQALAQISDLQIYLQLPSAEQVSQVRQMLARAGFGSARVQVEQGPAGRLHLADSIADGLIVWGRLSDLSEQEMLRVLRPGGRALLGQRRLVKPAPAGMDDWTHPMHGPDNNPLSLDRLARAPYLTQFLANPRYGPAPQSTVSAKGRVFKAFGHIAWHEREEPFPNTLVAFNGFNGSILWQRPLPEGLMVHRNTLIATDNTLYLGDDKSCKLIDTATGEIKREIIPPANVAGGTFWKWMALEGSTLYALLGETELADPTERWKRDGHGWPWTGISKGFNLSENPWGFGRNLLALDPQTGRVKWRYHEDEPMDSRALCMKSGRIFAFRFGSYLTCVNASTGQVQWRKTKQSAPELFAALGEYRNFQSWQTNWRTATYLTCSDQALYFAGTQLNKMLALSTEDGRILWQHPYENFQLIIQDDALYAISGPWGNNVSRKFDPLTGKVLAVLPTGRRACTRVVGTQDSILYRAMGGSIRFDVATDFPRWVSPMRPSCHDGVTVANGLLYWWPYACDCQLTLNGLTCLGAAGDFDFVPDSPPSKRLQRGAKQAKPDSTLMCTEADWPTFRANNQRTCVTQAEIPLTQRRLWQTEPNPLQDVHRTAPVVVDDLIVLADSEGLVQALNSNNGQTLWQAYTGAEIKVAPTIWQGRVLVGSGDGWVYSFAARTGELLWRFRAAPGERRMPVYGKLLSTWPAASGVLIEDDTAYVAAGLVNYDGTYVYALDPDSGRLRWCNSTSGHLNPEAKTGVSVQGHLLLNQDKLYLAGGNAVSPGVYAIQDGTCLNDPAALADCQSTSPRGWELFLMGQRVIACGKPFYAHPQIPVYDHTVTKKALHASNGQRDIVWLDKRQIRCYAPLDTEVLSQCVTNEEIPRHITQAWGEFKVADQPLWQQNVPSSVAIAVGPNGVVVADAKKVTALALKDGEPLWQQALPAAPVPWGMAVDRKGRVILTLVDGRVLCLGSAG